MRGGNWSGSGGSSGPVNLASGSAVTGVLPTANGGTGAASFAAARRTPLDANHIHAWECDEADGASAFVDTGSSAQKVNLAIANTANVRLESKGPFGSCALFGATSTGTSSVTRADALVSAFNDLPATNWTIECWAQQVQAGSGPQMFFSADYNASVNLQFGINDSASNNLLAYANANSFISPTSTLALFHSARAVLSWHHYALTYDGTYLRGYVDGELVMRTALAGNLTWTNTSGTPPRVVIGNQLNNGAGFIGRLACVRMSNVVRSQSYLRQVYATAMGF